MVITDTIIESGVNCCSNSLSLGHTQVVWNQSHHLVISPIQSLGIPFMIGYDWCFCNPKILETEMISLIYIYIYDHTDTIVVVSVIW